MQFYFTDNLAPPLLLKNKKKYILLPDSHYLVKCLHALIVTVQKPDITTFGVDLYSVDTAKTVSVDFPVIRFPDLLAWFLVELRYRYSTPHSSLITTEDTALITKLVVDVCCVFRLYVTEIPEVVVCLCGLLTSVVFSILHGTTVQFEQLYMTDNSVLIASTQIVLSLDMTLPPPKDLINIFNNIPSINSESKLVFFSSVIKYLATLPLPVYSKHETNVTGYRIFLMDYLSVFGNETQVRLLVDLLDGQLGLTDIQGKPKYLAENTHHVKTTIDAEPCSSSCCKTIKTVDRKETIGILRTLTPGAFPCKSWWCVNFPLTKHDPLLHSKMVKFIIARFVQPFRYHNCPTLAGPLMTRDIWFWLNLPFGSGILTEEKRENVLRELLLFLETNCFYLLSGNITPDLTRLVLEYTYPDYEKERGTASVSKLVCYYSSFNVVSVNPYKHSVFAFVIRKCLSKYAKALVVGLLCCSLLSYHVQNIIFCSGGYKVNVKDIVQALVVYHPRLLRGRKRCINQKYDISLPLVPYSRGKMRFFRTLEFCSDSGLLLVFLLLVFPSAYIRQLRLNPWLITEESLSQISKHKWSVSQLLINNSVNDQSMDTIETDRFYTFIQTNLSCRSLVLKDNRTYKLHTLLLSQSDMTSLKITRIWKGIEKEIANSNPGRLRLLILNFESYHSAKLVVNSLIPNVRKLIMVCQITNTSSNHVFFIGYDRQIIEYSDLEMDAAWFVVANVPILLGNNLTTPPSLKSHELEFVLRRNITRSVYVEPLCVNTSIVSVVLKFVANVNTWIGILVGTTYRIKSETWTLFGLYGPRVIKEVVNLISDRDSTSKNITGYINGIPIVYHFYLALYKKVMKFGGLKKLTGGRYTRWKDIAIEMASVDGDLVIGLF